MQSALEICLSVLKKTKLIFYLLEMGNSNRSTAWTSGFNKNKNIDIFFYLAVYPMYFPPYMLSQEETINPDHGYKLPFHSTDIQNNLQIRKVFQLQTVLVSH